MSTLSEPDLPLDNDWYVFAFSVRDTVDAEFLEQSQYVQRLESALTAAKEKLQRRATHRNEAHRVTEIYQGHALSVHQSSSNTFVCSPTVDRTAAVEAQKGATDFYVLTCSTIESHSVNTEFRTASANEQELIEAAKQWVTIGKVSA